MGENITVCFHIKVNSHQWKPSAISNVDQLVLEEMTSNQYHNLLNMLTLIPVNYSH